MPSQCRKAVGDQGESALFRPPSQRSQWPCDLRLRCLKKTVLNYRLLLKKKNLKNTNNTNRIKKGKNLLSLWEAEHKNSRKNSPIHWTPFVLETTTERPKFTSNTLGGILHCYGGRAGFMVGHFHHIFLWSRHTLEIVFFELNSIRKCDAHVETHDVWHSGKVLPLHAAASLVTMLKGRWSPLIFLSIAEICSPFPHSPNRL